MKKQAKELTYAQARELKFFCQNVVGVRVDLYSTLATVETFDKRIQRLEKTCELIEEFLGEKIEPAPTSKSVFDSEPEGIS